MSSLNWLTTHTAMVGAMAVASLPMAITTLAAVPINNDTARKGFTWVKAAFSLYFLGAALICTSDVLGCLVSYGVIRSSSSRYDIITQISDRMGDWSSFFLWTSMIYLFIAQVRIVRGIFYTWNHMAKGSQIMTYIAYGFGFLEVALAITIIGRFEAFQTEYYYGSGITSTSVLVPFRKLIGAFIILLFIAQTFVLGLCIYVKVLAKKRADTGKTPDLLLATSVLSFVRMLYQVVDNALYNLRGVSRPLSYIWILQAFFIFWLLFVELTILFAAGNKKYGGLWSTAQNFAAPPQYGYNNQAYGYGYDPRAAVGTQQYVQYEQAPQYVQQPTLPGQDMGYAYRGQAPPSEMEHQYGWQPQLPVSSTPKPELESPQRHSIASSPQSLTYNELRGSEAPVYGELASPEQTNWQGYGHK